MQGLEPYDLKSKLAVIKYENTDFAKLPNLATHFPGFEEISQDEIKIADHASSIQDLLDELKDWVEVESLCFFVFGFFRSASQRQVVEFGCLV